MNISIAILFGGAEGKKSDYRLLNDILIYKPPNSTWVKTNPKGEIPNERVAHACASIGPYYLSLLSEPNLYILDLSLGSLNDSIWYKMKSKGIVPCKRYGHSMIYNKPYLILFELEKRIK